MACFLEAAELLDGARPASLLPDTPHALGALSRRRWESRAAEHLLERALRHEAGRTRVRASGTD